MRPVSLSTLLLRVRRAADIESATARFPDAELTDYINEGLAELHELIESAFGEDFVRKTYTFSTTGQVASYSLPSDFQKLISVDVPLGGNLVLTARPYLESERNLYKFFPFGAWTMHQPIWYRLTGATDTTGVTAQTISFIPTPTGAYTVNCNYLPNATVLVMPSDTFDGIAGWEEFAVVEAARRAARKDKDVELYQLLTGAKAEVTARIEKMASEHDAGQPHRVADVTKDYETFDW